MRSLSSVQVGALVALNGMRELVANDMLMHDSYIGQAIVDQDLANSGAICGGRKACAIGSLWLGAGVKPVDNGPGFIRLPGADPDERRCFLRSRPALRLAYDALNAIAERYIAGRHVFTNDGEYEGAMEIAFEGYVDNFHPLDHDDFPGLIDEAELLITTEGI